MLEKNIEDAKGQLRKIENVISKTYDQEKIACYHHLLGIIKIAEGKTQIGLDEIRLAESSSPRNFLFFKKELVRNLLSSNKSKTALDEAIKLNSFYKNDPQLLMLIGDCYYSQGDNKKAHNFYLQASNELQNAEADFLPLTELNNKLARLSG